MFDKSLARALLPLLILHESLIIEQQPQIDDIQSLSLDVVKSIEALFFVFGYIQTPKSHYWAFKFNLRKYTPYPLQIFNKIHLPELDRIMLNLLSLARGIFSFFFNQRFHIYSDISHQATRNKAVVCFDNHSLTSQPLSFS
ncbi:hypothetical protein [Acinetobacter gyllenbergii]|uniref:hypothetical protein n=1 Tax=Acinetobacter gyllenbergii TaxID=134534 RepID=UPI003F57D30B